MILERAKAFAKMHISRNDDRTIKIDTIFQLNSGHGLNDSLVGGCAERNALLEEMVGHHQYSYIIHQESALGRLQCFWWHSMLSFVDGSILVLPGLAAQSPSQRPDRICAL